MAKKVRKKKNTIPSPGQVPSATPVFLGGTGGEKPLVPPPTITRRGWKLVFSGIGVVVLGFFILSAADPSAQNWAGVVAPFVILGGYALIGFGIITKNPA
jgi:hypothetical protein